MCGCLRWEASFYSSFSSPSVPRWRKPRYTVRPRHHTIYEVATIYDLCMPCLSSCHAITFFTPLLSSRRYTGEKREECLTPPFFPLSSFRVVSFIIDLSGLLLIKCGFLPLLPLSFLSYCLLPLFVSMRAGDLMLHLISQSGPFRTSGPHRSRQCDV